VNRKQRRNPKAAVDPDQIKAEQKLRELVDPHTPQEVTDPRAKSQRHRKVTADKWNQ